MMTRVQRNSDGALGLAEQKAAPATIREMLVDNLVPIGADVGDYVIALDNGDWDACAAADFPDLYTEVPG